GSGQPAAPTTREPLADPDLVAMDVAEEPHHPHEPVGCRLDRPGGDPVVALPDRPLPGRLPVEPPDVVEPEPPGPMLREHPERLDVVPVERRILDRLHVDARRLPALEPLRTGLLDPAFPGEIEVVEIAEPALEDRRAG